MKEFIIFVCTDSTEIFFSKLRSAGLNYNLLSFFTVSYCEGVSNKHCLLTFFHFSCINICRVTRKLLEHEAEWTSVQTSPEEPGKC